MSRDKRFSLEIWRQRFSNWNWDAWVVFLFLLMLAFNLNFLFPIFLAVPFWLEGVGMILALIGVLIVIGGELMLTAPRKKGPRLITSGIFKYTRNPMYLGFALLFFGLGLTHERHWFMVVGLITPFILGRTVVPDEEADLKKRFGKAWDDYARRTPRWLTLTFR